MPPSQRVEPLGDEPYSWQVANRRAISKSRSLGNLVLGDVGSL
jgi:hypothetical protein